MIPSVIVEIAWHLPGGRYHSPSIITAHRRWGHPHQRLYQCRVRENGLWTYFCGAQPVFHHTETDRQSFRMFTAQLICQGACRQVDIVARLRRLQAERHSQHQQVSRRGRESVLHASCDTRRYGDDAGGHRPGTTVVGAGWSRREVAEHLGLKLDTLRKAFQQGRLTEPGPLEPGATAPDKAWSSPAAHCHRQIHSGRRRCRG